MKRTRSRKNWVSASDVGRASFCPHYLELKEKGENVSKESIAARVNGDRSHDQLNRLAEDKRCYVATYLYGPEDDRTNLLRTFRDTKLINHCPGRILVKSYYFLSPHLVELARRFPAIGQATRILVDYLVNILNKGS